MEMSQADLDELMAAVVGPSDGATLVETPDAERGGSSTGSNPETKTVTVSKDLRRILDLVVPVIVRLAEQDMPVKKVLDLKLGSILEFDKPFEAELDLIVANHRIGKGQAVKVGENFGLRATRIGKIQETIRALAGIE